MFALHLCYMPSSIPALKRFPLGILLSLGKQALCLYCREALIPESDRNSNMLFETFSKCLHAFPLSVNPSIQADRQANNKSLGPCFFKKVLNGCPVLRFVAEPRLP